MTYLLGRNDPTPRLRPSMASGIAVMAITAGLVLGVQMTSGVPYRAWGSSDRALVVSEIVPVTVAAIFLIAFVGWSQWDSVWRDPFRLPVRPWVRIVVTLACLGVALRLAVADWGGTGSRTLVLLLLAALASGFTEELALRGVLLRALRVGRRPEIVCALAVTLASALVQLPVLAIGNRGLRPLDVAVAFCLGGLLYLVRRLTRLLWPAVLAHVAWDVGTVIDRAGGDLSLSGVEGVVAGLLSALVVVALMVTLRGDRTRRALVDPRLA